LLMCKYTVYLYSKVIEIAIAAAFDKLRNPNRLN